LPIIDKIEDSFEYNGDNITAGKVNLSVTSCFVDNKPVPKTYAVLLLHEKTKDEAWRLFEETHRSPLKQETRERIFETAYEKGFKEAYNLLDTFNAKAPNGEPNFYSAPDYNESVRNDLVEFTDGHTCFAFSTTFIVTSLKLPLNVYANSEYTGFRLDEETFLIISSCKREFFNLTKELVNTGNHVSDERRHSCLRSFFIDKAVAYKMLGKMKADAEHRGRRDEIYAELDRKDCLEFSNGFFVKTWRKTYYVSKDGGVYELCYRTTARKEAVQRAVEKGVLPNKMREENDADVLETVAHLLGKVKPELARVILP